MFKNRGIIFWAGHLSLELITEVLNICGSNVVLLQVSNIGQSAKLMNFDFDMQCKEGKSNIIANALSHQFEEYDNQQSVLHLQNCENGSITALSTVVPTWLETIAGVVKNETELKQLKPKWRNGELSLDWRYKDGILYYKHKI